MLKRKFGPTDVDVPIIGQGTWKYDRVSPSQGKKTLLAGIDAGMTHIDTAEMYGTGKVEEVVGSAISGRRDDVFLVSKVLPYNADYNGTLRACEESLRRLRTDRIDLYLLHWPSRYSLAKTLDAFRKLREDGKIVHYGVSNFDRRHLTKLYELTEPGEIACNQLWYSLRHRSAVERRVAEGCAERNLAVTAYSPLDAGRFSPSRRGAETLARVASDHGATPQQVALAFLLRRAADFVIPRSLDPVHTQQNAAAAEIDLDASELDLIDNAFPVTEPPKKLPITTDPWP